MPSQNWPHFQTPQAGSTVNSPPPQTSKWSTEPALCSWQQLFLSSKMSHLMLAITLPTEARSYLPTWYRPPQNLSRQRHVENALTSRTDYGMQSMKIHKTAKVLTASWIHTSQQCDPIHLPLTGFTYYWTLSSKFFSTFPHGTCPLSDSGQYLALNGVYHPLWAAFPNNPTPRTVQKAKLCIGRGLTPTMG